MPRARVHQSDAARQKAYRERKRANRNAAALRNSQPTRPLMRYFGGKWNLGPWIISFFPPHRIYVEPYGGAASVLLRKPRAFSEVYNDLDGEVANLFRILRDPARAGVLRDALRLTPFSRQEFELAYEPCEDPVERARRLLVRSWQGYAAGGRRHSKGFRDDAVFPGKSPPARDWQRLVESLDLFIGRLQGVCIDNRSALDVIRAQDTPGTLFYLDPPYPHDVRIGMRVRYHHEMTDDDHRALAACLHQIQGMAVISGYACDLYDAELYPTWRWVTRAANLNGGRQRERKEVLWISPNAAQPGLFEGMPF